MASLSPSGRRAPLRAPATRPPLRRLLWIVAELRSGRPLKATDVSRTFEIGLRTAYRDLDFLRDGWRVPLEYDRGAASYRLMEPLASLPAVTLSAGELLSLYFAEKVLQQYRGTPWESDLRSAFQKIHALVPDEIQASPADLDSLLSVDLGPLRANDAEVFRQVADALLRRRQLRVRYRSLSSARTLDRTLDPYRLFNSRGDWYLAAFDHVHREVRDFALPRITRAVVTDVSFVPDPAFDFRRYRGSAFGMIRGERPVEVVLRFSERQARWIRERQWHASARVKERRDGGLDLSLRVPLTGEIRRFALQFGGEVRVIRPLALRRAVEAELRRALRVSQGGRGKGREPSASVPSKHSQRRSCR